MRRAFSACLILFGGCFGRLEEPAASVGENVSGLGVPPAGHIILAEENSPGSWVPTEADVGLFESDLARLFANPDDRFEDRQEARLSEYFVRYYGTVRDGNRVITGEGTHVSETDLATFKQMNSREATVVLPPFGGGRMHFTALYDPAQKTIISVRFNAPL